MKRLIYFGVFLFSIGIAYSQTDNFSLESHNQERIKKTRQGMLILGSWAVGNMLISGGKTVTGVNDPISLNFHRMNIYWNIVNLGLAGFSFYSLSSQDPAAIGLAESLKEQKSIENILLFNAGLDVGYIMAGFYLNERGRRSSDRSAMLRGFGQSLVMQGAFLMLFDGIMYAVLSSEGTELIKYLDKVQLSANGFGLRFHLN